MPLIKLRAGRYMVPVQLREEGNNIILKFGFNRPLLNEIKMMEGARWNPDAKHWSFKNSLRNMFQLEYLKGNNPYSHYDKPLDLSHQPTRSDVFMGHQVTMFQHAMTRRFAILAAEMGTGKSLVAIEVAERIAHLHPGSRVWYVGPVSGVKSVVREKLKWKCSVNMEMMTYEALTKTVKNWTPGKSAPRLVIFDESTKIKTPSAQRSQAAMHISTAIRNEYGDDGYVLLMSGTPSPKDPTDWWHQTEVACPGFLKEGHVNKLKYNLALIKNMESLAGGAYPSLVTWWDNEEKCAVCGMPREHENHDPCTGDHGWKPSTNEVSRLHRRMEGLVLTVFKKDCADLPEIQYREIMVKPTREILTAAATLKAKVTMTVTLLGKLRELSDGFLYQDAEIEDETMTCPRCHGTGKCLVPKADEESAAAMKLPDFKEAPVEDFAECPKCNGTGQVTKVERIAKHTGSPKDDVLKEILDDHEDVGRCIVWGGFTATLDKLVSIIVQEGWLVLRVDGRGYKPYGDNAPDANTLLNCMDASYKDFVELRRKYPKVCFVGHPKAGGMGLTLTASPTELFYSNSFDGEARMQAEHRFHRIGMDVNRGATIIDLIMLPSDKLVLDNLKKKKKLQSLTLGQFQDAWADALIELEKGYV